MRRPRRPVLLGAALVATLTALGLSVTVAMSAQAATNTITNPGFETGDLSGWSCDPTDSVVTGHAHSGTYALAGAANNSSTAQCNQTVPVAANTTYTLTASVNGNYVYLSVTGAATATNWTPTTNNTQLTITFTTNNTTTLTVNLHGWYAQGTYYADDITMNGPTGPSPSPPRSTSPSPSTSPTTPPPPPPSGPLPTHVLTGYWQDFTNGATPLRLAGVPTSYDLIAVAFGNADPNTSGGVTFSLDSGLSSALGGYSDANFRADVATVHARGQHVILSVGGEKGNVSVATSAAATNFATSVHNIMTAYGFDGVDIDLENGLSPTFMAQALRSLSAMVGPNLIITLAPQTIDMQSTGGSYFQLALSIKDILSIVNTQYYNSGAMLGCDQNQAYGQGTENFLTALACIQLQSALRPDQVGLGLPANASGGAGSQPPSNVNAALDCLTRHTNCGSFVPPSTWPGVRGAMTWSINWDATNGYNFANTVKPHLATLP